MPIEDRRGFLVRAVCGAGDDWLLVAVRWVLRALSPVYGLGVRLRAWVCRSHILRLRRLPVPVISVGNLTVGGTGKTPMVEWIVRYLRKRRRSPAVLSRGYGAPHRGEPNDEVQSLERNVPGVVHVVDPDRARGGWQAVEEHDADCVVLDDGFQHIRLCRDLDIVLIDALDPFGNGRLLPGGCLREPPSALCRADVVVLTRSDVVSHDRRDALVERLGQEAPQAALVQAGLELMSLEPLGHGVPREPKWLAHKRVFAFCGLGNPLGFLGRLERLRPEVLNGVLLDDHAPYPPLVVEALARAAADSGADAVVTTQKDAVKIGAAWPGPVPALALRIRMRIIAGEELLEQRLTDVLSAG